VGRHGLGTSVRPSCAAPSGLVLLPYGAIVPEMLTKRARVALLLAPAILCTRSRPEQLSGRLPSWACGEGGWLRGDRQPSPATFPCFLRRLVECIEYPLEHHPLVPQYNSGPQTNPTHDAHTIDPRGLGTQLYSAASPNQVIKINTYHLMLWTTLCDIIRHIYR
jgi:hypothetical protein